jgi:hypothetical protein
MEPSPAIAGSSVFCMAALLMNILAHTSQATIAWAKQCDGIRTGCHYKRAVVNMGMLEENQTVDNPCRRGDEANDCVLFPDGFPGKSAKLQGLICLKLSQ